MNNTIIDEFIKIAITEDIGDGDHSSQACIPEDAVGNVMLLVKESGVLAGVEIGLKIFEAVSTKISVEVLMLDGDRINPGDVVLRAEGPVWALLQAERLVLNVMQRMSGIATKRNNFV